MTEHRPNERVTIHRGEISRSKRIALAFVFLWFLIGGIAHFVATDAAVRIVPPYVAWPRAAVL